MNQLRKKIEIIWRQYQYSKKSLRNKINAGCQTDDSDILFCAECEYPAKILFE